MFTVTWDPCSLIGGAILLPFPAALRFSSIEGHFATMRRGADIVRPAFHRCWERIVCFNHDPRRGDRGKRANSLDLVDTSNARRRRCQWRVCMGESLLVTTP